MVPGLAVGDRVAVDVGPVAHGGHCVARHDGQVIFVRHALPGERVVIEVTSAGRRERFLRADALDVLIASPDRRTPPCPVSGPGGCGGCDWQHATPGAARALKAAVVREAMSRFAAAELPGDFEVVAVPVDGSPAAAAGLGWRTRGTLSTDRRGRAGFLAARSHRVVSVADCPQLHPRVAAAGLFDRTWPAGRRLRFVAPSEGGVLAFPEDAAPPEPVAEAAAGRSWLVAADGFWQVHPGAADALVDHVRRFVAFQPGEAVADLYAGVGLFGISLVATAPGTSAVLVEGDRRACELAEANARDLPVRVVRAGVDRWARAAGALDGADVVVLDPPRVGAGAAVVRAICDAVPRAVAYVACDPVALARDVSTFAAAGYRLVDLVALDLFPTTHHVECVALLGPE